jgi:hypothetical protein
MVSGDEDLLDVDSSHNIPIVTPPADALRTIEAQK